MTQNLRKFSRTKIFKLAQRKVDSIHGKTKQGLSFMRAYKGIIESKRGESNISYKFMPILTFPHGTFQFVKTYGRSHFDICYIIL